MKFFFSLLADIDAWALRDGPATVLALFRIAFGFFLILYFGLKIPHVLILFSREGLAIPAVPPGLGTYAWLFPPPSGTLAALLFSVLMFSVILLTLGLWMRLAAGIAALLYAYYWILSLHLFPTSFDRIFIFFLIVLACSSADCSYSLRMLRERGSWRSSARVSLLPQRILMLQILITYLGVGWQKVVLPDWQSGEILPYSFLGMWGTPLAFWFTSLNIPLSFYDALVFILTAFEVALPFGLFFRKTRLTFIVGGTIFHLLVALFLGIWWFLVLIPSYVLLYEPEDVERWIQGIQSRFRRSRRLVA